MLLIVSPSKTMNDHCNAVPGETIPLFTDYTNQILRILKEFDLENIRSIMSVSEKLAIETQNQIQNFGTPQQVKGSAVFMYSGEVYNGLNATTFESSDLEFAQAHLRILSGLYGMLRPLDLIGAYRLEMGARIPIGQFSNLYKFWTEVITKQLQSDLEISGNNVLFNLASDEYYKVIDKKNCESRIVHFEFYDMKNGKPTFVSFNAKKARGLMAAYIIKNRITEPDQLSTFTDGGYEFVPELSRENEMVFVR